MGEHFSSWDELRIFLAVGKAGSLAGAARKLDVSHPTVFRRIRNLEGRLGVRLFERSRNNYALTPAGEELITVAELVDADITAVERRIAGQDLRPFGTVRVTLPDTLLFGFLSPLFAKFRSGHPEITLEVVVSNELLNISKRDADVAIRPSKLIPENLVGRKISNLGMAVYRHRESQTDINEPGDYARAPWIGLDHSLSWLPMAKWMSRNGLEESIVYRTNTLLGCFEAARNKIGLSVLPCLLGDGEGELVRLGNLIEELESELWLLTHPDLRNVARIRTFLDYMSEALRPHGQKFKGRK